MPIIVTFKSQTAGLYLSVIKLLGYKIYQRFCLELIVKGLHQVKNVRYSITERVNLYLFTAKSS